MAKLQAHQVDSANPIGIISPFAGRTAPAGWLLCYGQTVSRTTYSSLFNVIAPTIGTFTVTIATPAVVTSNAHGLVVGEAVYLTTTGALPTGLTANTLYYVSTGVATNTFNLSTTRANAYAGTKIATSGSQSGVHTATYCPHGLGDGSTTFTIPDLRGRVLAGNDYLGGTAASRLTNPAATTGGLYGNNGAAGGVETHTLTTAQIPSHTHGSYHNSADVYRLASNGAGADVALDGTAYGFNQDGTGAGGGTAHNIAQPTLVVNQIIKAV